MNPEEQSGFILLVSGAFTFFNQHVLLAVLKVKKAHPVCLPQAVQQSAMAFTVIGGWTSVLLPRYCTPGESIVHVFFEGDGGAGDGPFAAAHGGASFPQIRPLFLIAEPQHMPSYAPQPCPPQSLHVVAQHTPSPESSILEGDEAREKGKGESTGLSPRTPVLTPDSHNIRKGSKPTH
jgi:hypothetical protein